MIAYRTACEGVKRYALDRAPAYDASVTDDREFLLLVAACRASFADNARAPLIAAATGVDWQRLLALARRHRVEALAWHSLGPLDLAIPPAIAADFAQRASAIVEHNLRTAIECARLGTAFAAADVDLLFVKGLTLGALAYRTPFLKMGWDIDLLVAPGQIAEAAATLAAAGYSPSVPAPPASVVAWHRRHKESAWYRPDGDFHLDLHSRLSDHRGLIPAIGMASPRQTVTVAPGIDLPTLAADELFAYLCVHGASSAWFRLKWIADLAALLHGADEHAVDRLFARSQAMGAGRAAGQALLFADGLFAIQLSPALRATLRGDRTVRWLAEIAFAQLAGRRDLLEPTERRLGTVSIHGSQLLLRPGWRPLLSELGRQAGDLLGRR